jgi:hypothetical protein
LVEPEPKRDPAWCFKKGSKLWNFFTFLHSPLLSSSPILKSKSLLQRILLWGACAKNILFEG